MSQGDASRGESSGSGPQAPGHATPLTGPVLVLDATRVDWGEAFVALVCCAVTVVLVAGALDIPETASYARVGPRTFPLVVAVGFGILAIMLLGQALRGGWRPADPLALQERREADWFAKAMICGCYLIGVLSMEAIGFVFAAALMFFGTAWAFGERHILKVAATSLVFSCAVALLVRRGLTIPLPEGPIEWLLGLL